ncbi:MAG: hypothetical protein LBH04_06390 [Tannerellaceae bacterium]|jgi:hypothetical protein|nr:hypothetical protein [Tannerellaceae bacterium]
MKCANPNCHYDNNKGNFFCYNCGYPLWKTIILAILFCVIAIAAIYFYNTQHYKVISATIQRVFPEEDVYQDGQKGIKIRIKFITNNMKNISGECCVAFCNTAPGNTALKSYNDLYTLIDGNLGVWEEFVPNYEDTEFEMELFMPYSELQKSNEGNNISLVGFKVYLWAFPPSEEPQLLADNGAVCIVSDGN